MIKIRKILRCVNNSRGLTLIELLAVIVILAIIAAIAVPTIGDVIGNSREKAAKADVIMIVNSANLYFSENSLVNSVTFGVGATPNAMSFVNNLGTLSTLTVSKSGNSFTFSGEGVLSNGVGYTIASGTTLEQLGIDQPNRANDGMIIEDVSGDS